MERMKVLIVDDEPDVVQALETRLTSHGYEVSTAFDGAQATARIRSERPDLLLLDIHLPAGSGLTICERLRRHRPTHRLPVIAMTADPSLETRRRCHEQGCFAFFRKPYDPRRLLETIEEALRSSRGGAQAMPAGAERGREDPAGGPRSRRARLPSISAGVRSGPSRSDDRPSPA